MQRLANFLGGLRALVLNPLTVFIFIFGLVLGMAEQLEAQPSRYTIDDVMAKLIEMDKQLTVVESRIVAIEERIETVNANLSARINDTNTIMRWLFGFLGSLFLGILALTFTIYKNTAGLPKEVFSKEGEKPAEDLARVLESLQEEVRATAKRERVLEEKLQAAGVI